MYEFNLAPGISDFVELYLKTSNLSTTTGVAQQRNDYATLVQRLRAPRPAGITTRECFIDGRHGPVPLRHYRYHDGNQRAHIMFVHGGGFILGNLDTHDDICAELCANTGFDLTSIDYRLAPEHAHPAQLDDVEDAYLACHQPNTLLVGASAGGTLCAALSYRLGGGPSGQILIYPALGGECFDLDSYRDNAAAPLLSSDDVHFYQGVRCADGHIPLDDPEFYPLAAAAFDNAPPTVAFSADVDPLRDDARFYVEKLRGAGVDAEWINETGLIHDYLRARHYSDAAGRAFARICNAITHLAG